MWDPSPCVSSQRQASPMANHQDALRIIVNQLAAALDELG
jgi:hypothetical protein